MNTSEQLSIFSPVSIELTVEEFIASFPTASLSEPLQGHAEKVFLEMKDIWQPRGVLNRFVVSKLSKNHCYLAIPDTDSSIKLKTGHSTTFLQYAEIVVAGVYTSGSQLEKRARLATQEKRYLDGYIIEQLSLLILQKTGMTIHAIIEKEAINKNFLIGPLLSPGSVHGWDLTDQPNLCSCLPIDQIDVRCSENGVLVPFNSLSFIVGLGEKYTSNKVGSACEVCSKRGNCSEGVKAQ